MTPDERRRAQEIAAGLKKPGGKRPKYGNKKVIFDGMTFDSQRECSRWQGLRFLEAARHIANLERQVPIELMGQNGPILTPTGRKMRYVADFKYFDVRTGAVVIEDAKGFKTPEYKIKAAILAAMGLKVVEV